MLVNPCVTVVPTSWSLGDKIHYFGAVKIQEKMVLVP